jgi:hypothetical protein
MVCVGYARKYGNSSLSEMSALSDLKVNLPKCHAVKACSGNEGNNPTLTSALDVVTSVV